jgi:hypothetical protein
MAALAASISVYLLIIPTRSVFSNRNHVVMDWPRLKVSLKHFKAVRIVTSKVPPGSFVLAPKWVSVYLPTVNRYSYPLLIRPYQFIGPKDEFKERLRLVGVVSKKTRNLDTDWFSRALERYRISGIVMRKRALRTPRLVPILKANGFYRIGATGTYDIWKRRSSLL